MSSKGGKIKESTHCHRHLIRIVYSSTMIRPPQTVTITISKDTNYITGIKKKKDMTAGCWVKLFVDTE